MTVASLYKNKTHIYNIFPLELVLKEYNFSAFRIFAFNFCKLSSSKEQENLSESGSDSEGNIFQILLILKCRNF